jgi:UDP-N-acetylglucosamine--N-acetylmuramyl-(pentapeptide) pyrophosphoryl-undecaprenol N-acetylglucosamine transferase
LKVLFAAGGTGGHLYPAFAIAEALRARGDEVVFVGTKERLEARLVPAAGYPLLTIAAHPLRRSLSFDLIRTLVSNALGFVQSLRILGRVRPDMVVATGGYVCVPVVLAARARQRFGMSRTSIALLEPNAVPGIANRLLRRRVDEVWDARSTGVPVRSSLLQPRSRTEAASRLRLDPSKKVLFAFGASQGARSVNDALIELVRRDAIPGGWQLLLLTGERDFERVRDAVDGCARILPYLEDPADAYACADLVLARAGASTLAELAALGLPAILVPYPYATEGHQQANAQALASWGAAVVLEDSELPSKLGTLLKDLTQDEKLSPMRENARREQRRDATAAIVARIDALGTRSQKK